MINEPKEKEEICSKFHHFDIKQQGFDSNLGIFVEIWD
jgi:hypothetical protein